MHLFPLPGMVNVVVILFSTHFLRVNPIRKNLALAEAQEQFLKKYIELEHFLLFAGTIECLLYNKTDCLKIMRELVSEETVVRAVRSLWRRANA